jgi:GNAT superfamily N-acetyltransferase
VAFLRPEPLTDRHRLDLFRCEEPELTEWLRRYARLSQASGSARVYVTARREDPDIVVGYYALAAASVAPSEATLRAVKGQPRQRPVPAILLARLARDERFTRQGLGASLLQDALLRTIEAAELVGARVLLVHAKHERAKNFYLKYGFEESPTDPLHLLMLLKDVRAFVASHA